MMASVGPSLQQSGSVGQVADRPAEAPRAPVRKRNRQALSCTACRERKIKCDRTVPCSQCIKRGDRDHCHIEQKPKIDHTKSAKAQQQATAHRHNGSDGGAPPQQTTSSTASTVPVADQDTQGPMSPGTLAYSQFSAALSSDSAFPFTNPPPAEVDAIKARLALLESVLGQMSPASMSNLTLGSLSAGASVSPSSSTQPSSSWLQRSSAGSSPISTFTGATRSASTRSQSQGANSHSPASQDRAESESEEEPEWMSLRDTETYREPRKSSNSASPDNLKATQVRGDILSRKALDSDTEDAAAMLETVAMSSHNPAGPCPNSSSQAVGDSSANYKDFEEVTVGFERCLLRDKQHDLMAEDEQQAHSTHPASELEPDGYATASATTTGKRNAAPTALGTYTSGARNLAILGTSITDKRPSDELSSTPRGVGHPDCACGPACRSGHVSRGRDAAGAASSADEFCGALASKNELVVKACKVSCGTQGILRPKNGPETLLGFGMGWAYAAGDALLRQDIERAQAEGRTLLRTERTEREAVLRAMMEALPSQAIVNQLVEVYESRARYLCGHVIHIPCLRREIDAFFALESIEKRARVVNHVDAGWLAVLFSVLTLGLRFYPCQPKEGWVSVSHLFDGGQTLGLWHSASKVSLNLAGYLNSTSISVLQSILLNFLLLSGLGGVAGVTDMNDHAAHGSLIRVAISNAQEMGLHRLGDLDKQGTPNDPPSKVIRREIAKRVWWALVMKDWTSAAAGCRKDYALDRDRFNTPLPGNYNDEDLLLSPLPPPRPKEEYTEMSYVLASYEFGLVMKEDFDMRNRREMLAAATGGDRRLTCSEARKLDQQFRSVLDNAPSFFRVGTEEGRATCIEVQRYLLQQGVFSKLLRIHRPTLSSQAESRLNCVLLARSILDMQKKIRSKCTVIDRLWINLMQSFSAAIVLGLHLLHSRPTPEHRLSVRSEITEAIHALKQVDGSSLATQKCIRVIEALLVEEEDRWQAGSAALSESRSPVQSLTKTDQPNLKRKWQNERSAPTELQGSGRRRNLLSLAQRVAAAAKSGGATDPHQLEAAAAAAAAPSGADGSSKRAATQAAVHNGHAGDGSTATTFASSSAGLPLLDMAANGATALNGITLPNPGLSPLPALSEYSGGNSGSSGSSFDFRFPVLPNNGQQQNAVYDFGSSQTGSHVVTTDATRRALAPNGVDMSLNNPNTPPDGQSFDLAAFLQQCENSPGSSSEGGEQQDRHSASFASETSGFADSRSASSDGWPSNEAPVRSPPVPNRVEQASAASQPMVVQQTAMAQPPTGGSVQDGLSTSPNGAAQVDASTNMDSFWNWILNQAGNPALPLSTAPAAPLSTTTAAATNPQAVQPHAGQSTGSAASAQPSMHAGSYGSSETVAPHTGLTPFFDSSSQLFTNVPTTAAAPSTASQLTTGPTTSAAVAPYPAFLQMGTPSSNVDSTADPLGGLGAFSEAPASKAPPAATLLASVSSPAPFGASLQTFGTPSAELGVESVLGGAPLYDFTDYALAWTASNPNAASNTATSHGPIWDP